MSGMNLYPTFVITSHMSGDITDEGCGIVILVIADILFGN